MCMYIYIYMSIYMCMQIYMHTRMHGCTYICMCMHGYIYIYIYMHIYTYTYIYILYMYIYTYIYLYICIYICIRPNQGFDKEICRQVRFDAFLFAILRSACWHEAKSTRHATVRPLASGNTNQQNLSSSRTHTASHCNASHRTESDFPFATTLANCDIYAYMYIHIHIYIYIYTGIYIYTCTHTYVSK